MFSNDPPPHIKSQERERGGEESEMASFQIIAKIVSVTVLQFSSKRLPQIMVFKMSINRLDYMKLSF